MTPTLKIVVSNEKTMYEMGKECAQILLKEFPYLTRTQIMQLLRQVM